MAARTISPESPAESGADRCARCAFPVPAAPGAGCPECGLPRSVTDAFPLAVARPPYRAAVLGGLSGLLLSLALACIGTVWSLLAPGGTIAGSLGGGLVVVLACAGGAVSVWLIATPDLAVERVLLGPTRSSSLRSLSAIGGGLAAIATIVTVFAPGYTLGPDLVGPAWTVACAAAVPAWILLLQRLRFLSRRAGDLAASRRATVLTYAGSAVLIGWSGFVAVSILLDRAAADRAGAWSVMQTIAHFGVVLLLVSVMVYVGLCGLTFRLRSDLRRAASTGATTRRLGGAVMVRRP